MNNFLAALGSSTEIFIFLGLSVVLFPFFLPKNIRGLSKKRSFLIPIILVQTFILFIVLIFFLGYISNIGLAGFYFTMFFISFLLTVIFNIHFLIALSEKGKNPVVSDVIKESAATLFSVFIPIFVIFSSLYVFIGGSISNLILFTSFFVLINFLMLGFLTPAILHLLESI
ncbi:hypothetical protein ACFLZ4_00030 [Patescibacteria group bacterium]